MRIKAYYAIIFIIVASFIVLSTKDEKTRSFQFKYEVKLDKSDDEVKVWVPIPQSNEVQVINNLNLENDGMNCELLTEAVHKNQYYYCRSNKLDEDAMLVLSFDVDREEHGVIQYSGVDPMRYNRGTNNMTVFEGGVFNNIISENNLSADNIKGIYDYVLSGMHYGKPKDSTIEDQYYSGRNPKTNQEWLPDTNMYGLKKVSKKVVVDTYKRAKNDKTNYTFGNGNSVYACDIGVGNCTDYHSYFMSLSRTLDIPSRFHMGFNVPNKKEGKIGGYHCWADYYIDGEGWSPVDISEADKDPNKAEYFFGNLDNNRVEFTVGRDLQLKEYDSVVNFFVYPIVEGTYYSKNFSFKNL